MEPPDPELPLPTITLMEPLTPPVAVPLTNVIQPLLPDVDVPLLNVSDPDTPADIKPGVIFMYNELGIPCVPVALNTGLCWQGSGFIRKPGRVIFEVLAPIEPGLKRAEFTQRLKDALDPATQKLVAEGRASQK